MPRSALLVQRLSRATGGTRTGPRADAFSLPISGLPAADVIILATLVAAAAAVRYVYLWDVPRFRDETFGALLALEIYRGERFPLTDVEYYIGPLFNYIVAGAMVVFGPTIYLPRLVVMVFGALTVGVTYLVGREVGGRPVGLIAAGLLLTNAVHVASISHRGFSADMAVFFSTVGFWLLHRAVARQRPRTLAWSGFFLGLALHTHPTTIAFLPGALTWLLPHARSWLRTPWPYVAFVLFVLAYSPMVAFNIQTGGGSLRHAVYTATERPDYALGESTALTFRSYLDRQAELWALSLDIIGGEIDSSGRAPFRVVPTLLAAVWATLALVYAARRGYALPLWLLGSCAFILPVFNAHHWDVLGDAHYVAKVLPTVYAAMGLLVVAAVQRTWRWRPPASHVLTSVLVVVVAATILAQFVPLSRYYADALKSQPSNASLIQVIDEVKAARGPDELVLLDDALNDQRVANAAPWDEASTFRVMRFIMAFDDVPCRVLRIDDEGLAALAALGQSFVLILSPGSSASDTAELTRRIDRFGLQDLNGQAARPVRPADRYAIYRLTPHASAGTSGDGTAVLSEMRGCGQSPVLPSV